MRASNHAQSAALISNSQLEALRILAVARLDVARAGQRRPADAARGARGAGASCWSARHGRWCRCVLSRPLASLSRGLCPPRRGQRASKGTRRCLGIKRWEGRGSACARTRGRTEHVCPPLLGLSSLLPPLRRFWFFEGAGALFELGRPARREFARYWRPDGARVLARADPEMRGASSAARRLKKRRSSGECGGRGSALVLSWGRGTRRRGPCARGAIVTDTREAR